MFTATLYSAILLALTLGVDAFWRLPCRDRVAVERVDPLVLPGQVAGHVHTVMGSNAFNANATTEDLKAGTCSSCQVKQDRSAYWTPAMYFQHADGQFEIVPQTSGMLVYYLQRGENVKAFPPGFQMLAGDPFLRNFGYREIEKSFWTAQDRTEDALRQKAVGFNCLNYKEPANAALGLRKMPDDLSKCKDGLRAEVFFPSCWDGERLDSPDHKDHMRYPSLMDDGVCPDSHPVRLVSLFFETIWYVDRFTGKPGRFVWSQGDPTGYGYHGDFMNGWDQATLEKAVAECRSPTGIVEECEVFEHYTVEEMQQCKVEQLDTDEDVFGLMSKLPGCNPVQEGPMKAMRQSCGSPGLPYHPESNTLTYTTPAVPESKVPSIETPAATSLVRLSSSLPEVVAPTATPDVKKEDVPRSRDPYLVVVTVTSTRYVDVYAEPTPAYPAIRKRSIHRHHKRHGH